MARIVLAMSGGVDSSVAAHLLVEQGHEVIGVFMRHGVGQEQAESCRSVPGVSIESTTHLPILPRGQERLDHKQGCCTARDAADARRVADRLGIPFYALNLDEDFARIVDYFVEDYLNGRTPNPCVMCNNWIKFGKLFDYAGAVGADFVATGHYARLQCEANGKVSLWRGLDAQKDQSYVLFGVQRDDLPRMMLPLGTYCKQEIRTMAQDWKVLVADKRDSQEICFVTSGEHAEFVKARRPHDFDTTGEFVTTDGRVVGEHDGIERFTVGQRKGLGIALGQPYFVVRIEPETRRVVLGKRHELACQQLTAHRLNWLDDPPQAPFRCLVQIRYNSGPKPAKVNWDAAQDVLQVHFDEPCLGVAPGQAAVCYDETRVLGGGWIATTDISTQRQPKDVTGGHAT
jgi:tRNA-specific 2-thiouridylase